MNEWLIGLAGSVGAWIIIELGGAAILEPVLKPLARLYDPPHGTAVLVLTWIAAVASLWVAFQIGDDWPTLAVALVMLGIPIALIASFTYRDAATGRRSSP